MPFLDASELSPAYRNSDLLDIEHSAPELLALGVVLAVIAALLVDFRSTIAIAGR
jgi:hypothetical protein